MYLDAADAVLPAEVSPVPQPVDGGGGAARGRTAELHRVSGGNGIQLLLHALSVRPVRP